MKKIITVTLILTFTLILINCSPNTNITDPVDTQNSWTTLNSFNGGSNLNICSNGTNLFVGTESLGVFMSSNNGDTWTLVNNGIVDKKNCVVFSFGGNVYVSTTVIQSPNLPSVVKYYKSTNNGQNWTPIWSSLQNLGHGCPSIIRSFGSTLIGTAGSSQYCYKSIDNGSNWIEIQLSTQQSIIPTDFAYDGTNIYALSMSGLYKSTSNSAFNPISIPNTVGQDGIAALGTKIYLSGYTGQEGVFMSSDGANSWNAVNNGLEIQIQGSSTLPMIKPLYSDGTNLYLSVGSAVYILGNSGANWSKVGGTVSGSIPNNDTVSHILRNGAFLFVTSGSKIYRMPM